MVSELSLNNIWPLFWPKNNKKIVKFTFLVYFDVFCSIYELNIIQTQFQDHIWNPLIKANLLYPQYESWIELFFWLPIVFSKFYLLSASRKSSCWGVGGWVRIKIIPCFCPSPIARDLLRKHGKACFVEKWNALLCTTRWHRANHGHRVRGRAVPILQHRAHGMQFFILWWCK